MDPTSLSLSRDLTFVTNEPGNNLRDRLNTLLTKDTHFFDCLVGYFYISGFHKIYPALQNVEKVRILVGLQTDRAKRCLSEGPAPAAYSAVLKKGETVG